MPDAPQIDSPDDPITQVTTLIERVRLVAPIHLEEDAFKKVLPVNDWRILRAGPLRISGNQIDPKQFEIIAERDMIRSPRTVLRIQQTVCERFNISFPSMLDRRKHKSVAWPRQIAMFLVHELTQHSFQEIADAFNRKNHGTVMHACRAVQNVIDTDMPTKILVDDLRRFLGDELLFKTGTS